MYKHSPVIILIVLSIMTISFKQSNAQILITEDENANPHPSAMLEIQSTDKGLLIPRMSSTQRVSIYDPQVGLLVYDTDLGSFFIYGNNSLGEASWIDLSKPSEIWQTNSSNVFLGEAYTNLGVGTNSPGGKLVIKADASKGPDDPLFEIQDNQGNPVFVVTSEGARIYIKDFTKGVSGGFAVGKYGIAKGIPDTTYFMVSPDSTRVFTDDAAGASGGFAVGKYGIAKGKKNFYFFTGMDSTRVYTNDGMKGSSGGFAVGKYGIAKGIEDYSFYTARDSTRVYTNTDLKGVSGGFAVGKYGIAKGSAENYMHMTKNNYLIGHSSGRDMEPTGLYNIFVGYETGIANTTGSENFFVGYQSGYSNTGGNRNVFSGYQSGYFNKTASYNTFTGYRSGYNNTTGTNNSFYGYSAGYANTVGTNNVFLGSYSGYQNDSSDYNMFMGYASGYRHRGNGHDNNIYIGWYSGYGNATAGENGQNNVFLGTSTGRNNNSGREDIFIGFEAGYNNTIGQNNIFMGTQAGYTNTSGGANVFIGYQAGYSNLNTFGAVSIGDRAGALADAPNSIYIGRNAGEYANGSQYSTMLGANAGQYAPGVNNVYIGSAAGIGWNFSHNDGNYNVFLGTDVGKWNTNGDYNTFTGDRAGFANSTGDYNSFLGHYSGRSNSTGYYNTAVGAFAGYSAEGYSNVFIGYKAGYNYTGGYRLYIDNSDTDAPLIYGNFSTDFLRFNAYVDIANPDGFTALQVNGSEAIWYDGTYFSWGYGGTANYFSDNLGIGITAPSYQLQLSLNSAAKPSTSTWTIASDKRLKDIKGNYEKGLKEILLLDPIIYRYKNDNEMGIKETETDAYGFIAQDVLKIFPEAVATNDKGFLDFNMHPILIAEINAFKTLDANLTEQQIQIINLQQRIDELEKQNSEIDDLKKQIQELKALIENQ